VEGSSGGVRALCREISTYYIPNKLLGNITIIYPTIPRILHYTPSKVLRVYISGEYSNTEYLLQTRVVYTLQTSEGVYIRTFTPGKSYIHHPGFFGWCILEEIHTQSYIPYRISVWYIYEHRSGRYYGDVLPKILPLFWIKN